MRLVAVDIFPECCDPNYRKAQEREIAKYHYRRDLVLVHVTVIAQPRSFGLIDKSEVSIGSVEVSETFRPRLRFRPQGAF